MPRNEISPAAATFRSWVFSSTLLGLSLAFVPTLGAEPVPPPAGQPTEKSSVPAAAPAEPTAGEKPADPPPRPEAPVAEVEAVPPPGETKSEVTLVPGVPLEEPTPEKPAEGTAEQAAEPAVDAPGVESPVEAPAPGEELPPDSALPLAETANPPAPGAAPTAEEQKTEAEKQEDKRNAYERCGDGPDDPTWLDKFGYGVYRTVCASATWLDNFFGGDRGLRERDRSYGRVGVGASWDEFNGTSAKFRFKAKVQFPNTENRFNAFLGRYEEDEFIQGQVDDVGSVPAIFRETQEKDWLLGFGYNPVRSSRSRVDVDAGVRLDFPIDPFVKGTWRYYAFMSDTRLLRIAQTVFWTNHLEFGTTTRVDAERVLGENLHVRWQGLGTMAQKTEGVDWRTSLILYQHLGGLRAIAWEAEAEGETDAYVPVEFYGLRAVYRQRFFRDDLFLELQARLFWPKSIDHPEREATPGIGFGFEMLWGDQPKLTLRRSKRTAANTPATTN